MSEYAKRAREYQTTIRKILLKEWDPIGVADIPEAQDEYDSYVPHIYSQLIHHKSEEEVFNNLWQIETDHMDLCGDRQRTEKIVKRFMELRDQIEKNC